MADVLNRVTKQYLKSVDTPKFDPADWIVNPDLSAVVGTDPIYWTITGDAVTLKSVPEQTVVNESRPKLSAVSDAAADFDLVPAVKSDGAAFHTVTVKKLDLKGSEIGKGTDTLRVLPSSPVPVSGGSFAFTAGVGTFTVGPVDAGFLGDVDVKVADALGVIQSVTIKLRFM